MGFEPAGSQVTGSNPVEALIFFRLLLSSCLSWKIYCDDHLFHHNTSRMSNVKLSVSSLSSYSRVCHHLLHTMF